jgi:hypothetical protein
LGLGFLEEPADLRHSQADLELLLPHTL